jgi:hypothetical protein
MDAMFKETCLNEKDLDIIEAVLLSEIATQIMCNFSRAKRYQRNATCQNCSELLRKIRSIIFEKKQLYMPLKATIDNDSLSR